MNMFQKLGQPYTGNRAIPDLASDLSDVYRQSEAAGTPYEDAGGAPAQLVEQPEFSANPIKNPVAQEQMLNKGLWGAGIGAGAGALLAYLLKDRRESGLGAAARGAAAGAGLGGLTGAGLGYYSGGYGPSSAANRILALQRSGDDKLTKDPEYRKLMQSLRARSYGELQKNVEPFK